MVPDGLLKMQEAALKGFGRAAAFDFEITFDQKCLQSCGMQLLKRNDSGYIAAASCENYDIAVHEHSMLTYLGNGTWDVEKRETKEEK